MQAVQVRETSRVFAATRSRMGTIVVMGGTAALILGVAFFVNQPARDASGLQSVTLSTAATGVAPEVGKPAPDFAALTADGAQFRLSDLRGTPVWLTFGASWCQPCRAENPDILAAAQANPGVRVVQVYLAEDAATVSDYAGRVGLTYTTIADSSTRISAEYRILGIPSHFFIDANGVLHSLRIGTLDPRSMDAAIAGILP